MAPRSCHRSRSQSDCTEAAVVVTLIGFTLIGLMKTHYIGFNVCFCYSKNDISVRIIGKKMPVWGTSCTCGNNSWVSL